MIITACVAAAAALAACDDPKPATTADSATAAPTDSAPAASATASDSAATADSATPPPTAEPTASGSGDVDPPPAASSGATATAPPGKKEYDCGGKGQKACPMQGWMKGVMARAMASGDGDKIASALNRIASKPVSGYGSWSSIAAEGAAKAAAGDIDGAKASCKKCHGLYQKKYKATRRDQPW